MFIMIMALFFSVVFETTIFRWVINRVGVASDFASFLSPPGRFFFFPPRPDVGGSCVPGGGRKKKHAVCGRKNAISFVVEFVEKVGKRPRHAPPA